MLEKIKANLKNKSFWAGVAAAVSSVLAGAISAPEAFINILTSLIGG